MANDQMLFTVGVADYGNTGVACCRRHSYNNKSFFTCQSFRELCGKAPAERRKSESEKQLIMWCHSHIYLPAHNYAHLFSCSLPGLDLYFYFSLNIYLYFFDIQDSYLHESMSNFHFYF